MAQSWAHFPLTIARKWAHSNITERLDAMLYDSQCANGFPKPETVTVLILREAIENNAVSLVKCLLDNQVPMKAGHFKMATQNTSYQILQAFLDHGWDINTPINSHTPPALDFSYHDADLTMWFLAHGANPNQRCGKDRTPLSTAFEVASFEIIQKLLERGADVFQGQVLHYAARRRLDDRLRVLDFLLEKGVPINNIMFQDSDDYYSNMFGCIGTPLHYAADAGLLDSVKLLVERGASARIRDPAGQIALDWAEYNNHKAVTEFLRPLSVGNDPNPVAQFTDEPGRHFTVNGGIHDKKRLQLR